MTPIDNQVDVLRPQPEVGQPKSPSSSPAVEHFSTRDLPSTNGGKDPRDLLGEIAEGENRGEGMKKMRKDILRVLAKKKMQ
jgi:hypothetical protein